MSEADTEFPPIKGVIFDFHATLFDARGQGGWVRAAQAHRGRAAVDGSTPESAPPEFESLSEYLDKIWDHASTIDPHSERDLSHIRHRAVFSQTVGLYSGIDQNKVDTDLIEALYAVMADQWIAFDDTLPVVRELKARGTKIAILSNIGVDIRPCLQTAGLADLIDGVVLSYKVGAVKPEQEIFVHALKRLGLHAGEVLMVGDNWRADAGAAALGIRTLILPRTTGTTHGLGAVLRLVGE